MAGTVSGVQCVPDTEGFQLHKGAVHVKLKVAAEIAVMLRFVGGEVQLKALEFVFKDGKPIFAEHTDFEIIIAGRVLD